jgi:hypothetical protein
MRFYPLLSTYIFLDYLANVESFHLSATLIILSKSSGTQSLFERIIMTFPSNRTIQSSEIIYHLLCLAFLRTFAASLKEGVRLKWFCSSDVCVEVNENLMSHTSISNLTISQT